MDDCDVVSHNGVLDRVWLWWCVVVIYGWLWWCILMCFDGEFVVGFRVVEVFYDGVVMGSK